MHLVQYMEHGGHSIIFLMDVLINNSLQYLRIFLFIIEYVFVSCLLPSRVGFMFSLYGLLAMDLIL